MTSETEALNADEDRYADEYEMLKRNLCAGCPLPQIIVAYEEGFKILQKQLARLKEEMKGLTEKIDTLDYRKRTDG